MRYLPPEAPRQTTPAKLRQSSCSVGKQTATTCDSCLAHVAECDHDRPPLSARPTRRRRKLHLADAAHGRHGSHARCVGGNSGPANYCALACGDEHACFCSIPGCCCSSPGAGVRPHDSRLRVCGLMMPANVALALHYIWPYAVEDANRGLLPAAIAVSRYSGMCVSGSRTTACGRERRLAYNGLLETTWICKTFPRK